MKPLTLSTLVVAVWVVAAAPRATADEGLTREEVREEISAYLENHAAGHGKGGMLVSWRHGLHLESGDAKINIGGRALIDASFHDDSDLAPAGRIGDLEDGLEFHQVWLRTVADLGTFVRGKIQIAFESGEIKFQDVYLELRNLRDCAGCGMPNVRIGHFFEPFSLNTTTPGTRLTFMERALPTTLSPFRSSGLMVHDSFRGGRFGYAAGVFGNSNRVGEANFERDGYAATGRLWWTPWAPCDCTCQRLHLGVSFSHRRELSGVRYAARPEDHLSRVFADTDFTTAPGPMGMPLLQDAKRANLYGAEIAYVNGPWSVQAEYIRSDVTSVAGGDPTFQGWYAFVSYWITGECRRYGKGGFGGRVVPCCSFLGRDCCCSGGLEIALRYSALDLTDANIVGGEVSDWTLGLNWHLHPNARVMFNFIHSRVDDGVVDDQSANIFAVRFQVDF